MDSDDEYTIECTEDEFHELTEKLLDNDENNCARFFRYNLQQRRQGTECLWMMSLVVCHDSLSATMGFLLLQDAKTCATNLSSKTWTPTCSKYRR